MLSRQERLKYSGLFQQAYQQGRSFYSKNLKLSYTKTRESHKDLLPFVGITISKNYSKSAVKRNLIKRRLNEIYRLYRQAPDNATRLKTTGLLVIGLKKSTTLESKLNYQDLKRELEELLNKI